MGLIVIIAVVLFVSSFLHLRIRLILDKGEGGRLTLTLKAAFVKRRWFVEVKDFKLYLTSGKGEPKGVFTIADVVRQLQKSKGLTKKERTAKNARRSYILGHLKVAFKRLHIVIGCEDAFLCALIAGSVVTVTNTFFAALPKNLKMAKRSEAGLRTVYDKNTAEFIIDCIIGVKAWHIIRGYIKYFRLRK